jgi:sugar O-acyltransferase (sialic acid O-acetyltransferase NeuD family)
MTMTVVIIGSGGHAAVVADAMLAAGRQVLGFTDSDANRHGAQVCGLPVLGDDGVLAQHHPTQVQLANGIGGTRGEALRARVQGALEARGWQFTQVRHPSAVVSPFAEVAGSAQLMARAVVQPRAVVGEGCIINTGAVIEHDVRLGAFVHVACGAVLCGEVQVGSHSHIGAAAVVRQGVVLGAHTVVGAGAAVVRPSVGGMTLVGVPAIELGSNT